MINRVSKSGDLSVGESIRDLRTAKGLSIRELSELSGFSSAAISRWESGKRIPTVKAYNAIMTALGAKLYVMD